MLAVFKREIRAYFTTPSGYIFMGFFLLITGFFFSQRILLTGSPNYTNVLSDITFVFLIVVPVLTMRLFSEEMKQRTSLLLFTNPLSLSGIVLGKYFAAVVLFLITLLVTSSYPVIMSFFGPIAGWEILGGYIGFFLLGSAFIAVGLFVSSLTENQVVAGVITFAALFIMWLIDWIQQGLPKGTTAGIVFSILLSAAAGMIVFFTTRRFSLSIPLAVAGITAVVLVAVIKQELFDGLIVRFFRWFSLLERYESFLLGVLALGPVIYYISFSSIFIFLTIRIIEKRRWV